MENGKLKIDPKAGVIFFGKNDPTFDISVSTYNDLIKYSKWQLIDVYKKNDMITSSWKNKETNEERESIGIQSPSDLIKV